MTSRIRASRRALPSFVVLVVATVLVAMPFLWMVSLALKGPEEIAASVPRLIPSAPGLGNVTEALEGAGLLRAMANSFAVGLGAVVANCVIATLAGYAFAKLSFRGSNVLFYGIVATAMVPGAVTLVPLFLIAKGMPLAGGNDILGVGGTGLLDSLPGVLLPHLLAPLNVFLARQYFLELPDELGEAGRVDGASELRILLRIYVPLARPIVAVVAIFSFTASWDDFLWPLVVTSSEDVTTVQLALASFLSGDSIAYGPAMAAAVLVTLPVLAVFVFNQRHFISGLSAGGVKG